VILFFCRFHLVLQSPLLILFHRIGTAILAVPFIEQTLRIGTVLTTHKRINESQGSPLWDSPLWGNAATFFQPMEVFRMVSFEDFKKLELRIAEIESVALHPNADKLYVIGIKVGEVRKTVVAGIRSHYTETELRGKKVVVVDNLTPATIRGVESQGMLLAASDDTGLTLVVPERAIGDGATVK